MDTNIDFKRPNTIELMGEIVGLKLELSVKTLAGYEKRERVPTKKYLQNSVSMIRSEQKRVDPIKAISGGKMNAFVRINRMETLDLLCPMEYLW